MIKLKKVLNFNSNYSRKTNKQTKKKKNTSVVTLLPKSQPAPRGLTAQVSISSGSDHIKSIYLFIYLFI